MRTRLKTRSSRGERRNGRKHEPIGGANSHYLGPGLCEYSGISAGRACRHRRPASQAPGQANSAGSPSRLATALLQPKPDRRTVDRRREPNSLSSGRLINTVRSGRGLARCSKVRLIRLLPVSSGSAAQPTLNPFQPRHIAPRVQISRTGRTCLPGAKSYGPIGPGGSSHLAIDATGIRELTPLVQAFATPPLPAEALASPGTHPVLPELLLYPAFDHVKTRTRMSDPKVVHPTTQNRIDFRNHNLHGPADVLSEDLPLALPPVALSAPSKHYSGAISQAPRRSCFGVAERVRCQTETAPCRLDTWRSNGWTT